MSNGAHHHHHHEGSAHTHGGTLDQNSVPHRRVERGRLRFVLAITAGFMLVELVGGLVSGSLALVADAGHMFSDVSALALSLFAMGLAARPPSPTKTYGYGRSEVLAALLNGATLIAISALIVWEAVDRARNPVAIDGGLFLLVAGIGLLVNIVGATALHAHAHENLNVRGAYLHVLGDLLGSVGAIVAAGVILLTGWTLVDPIVSVVIALLILIGAWRLTSEATDVLMEGAPAHVDVEALVERLGEVDGLTHVHDVHVWTLTSGFVAMSGHAHLADPMLHSEALDRVRALAAEFGIRHVTFQLEPLPLYELSPSRPSADS